MDKQKVNFKKIKEISGVGDALYGNLIKAGYTNLESIAFTPPQIIQQDCGMGFELTMKLIKFSMEKLNIGFRTGRTEFEQRKKLKFLTTGSKELDELLGGGIESGSITEFFGEFRTGKTQLMHQLCVNVQLSKERGGLEGKAIFIDTEGTFRPERIIQMAEALELNSQETLDNITYAHAYNSNNQIVLLKKAFNIINSENIRLLVIDSIIGHFRSEYGGRGMLARRQQAINKHMHDLSRLCDIFPYLLIAITNQVSAKLNGHYGSNITATGGNIVAHNSTIRINLRKAEGETRIARVVDAPHLSEGEAVLNITEKGIKN